MTSPPSRSSMAHEANDDNATAKASLSSSSNMLMTPLASPSTLARRKQETSCLVPPTLKRKRGEDDHNSFPVLSKNLERNLRILKLQSQNISSDNNKRRMTSTSSKHHCRYRPTKGPVPILCLDDVTSRGRVLSSMQQDRQGVPVLSLRPRTNNNKSCFQQVKEQHHQQQQDYLYDIQEQDENVPTRQPRATYTSSIVESALTIASSTITAGKDDSMVALLSSPPLPPKTVKTFLQRNGPASCSLGGAMTVQASSPLISTPLLTAAAATAAAAAVAAPCNSGSSSSNHSFLTLSLSKRKLSFGGGGGGSSSSQYNCRNSWNGGNSFQTPTCSTTTSLVQSLEGLCLPSLEDVDCVNVNKNGPQEDGRTAPATRILQQKRAPTTPQQQPGNHNNHHRGAVSTTFDYLATALRLPDIAFTGSSGSSM